MTKKIEPRTLPGFRDFLPDTMRIRNRVIGKFREIFERYGFQPLETPALEYQDILLGKYGEEAEKLMFLFKDNGSRDVGLRYDLTVPTARVLAQYPNLPKPFKRYQIQPAWRAEKPQKGRYREFTQCDIDTFGNTSALTDAEIVAIIYECLSSLQFNSFTIRINSRQVLFSALKKSGLQENKYMQVLQSLDKLDKKDFNTVIKEVQEKGVSEREFQKLNETLREIQPDDNLKKIIEIAIKLGVDSRNIEFFRGLVRGLDYYTGAIFETVVNEPKIGSITGGGRYDKLIGQFTGQDTPAVGTTIGLDRVVDVIQELKLWDVKQPAKALETIFSPSLTMSSLATVTDLRAQGLSVEIYPDENASLEKQLKYADKNNIPKVIIQGPEEISMGTATVKDLISRTQKTIPLSDLPNEIQ